MLTYLQHHVLLAQMAIGLVVAAVGTLVLWIALRPEQDPYDAAHRSWRRAWRLRAHEPRHAAVVYHAHHAAGEPGPRVYLGRTPDGELALVDDEHTHELVGAAA